MLRYVLLTLIVVGALWALFHVARVVERGKSAQTRKRLETAEQTLTEIERVAMQNVDIDPSQGIVIQAVNTYRKEVAP